MDIDKAATLARLNRVFSPSAPVDDATLFAGRSLQINQLLSVAGQRGQHAIIFGERGVGKTSLANILSPVLRSADLPHVAVRVNCDASDDFQSIWTKVFANISITIEKKTPGFVPQPQSVVYPLSELANTAYSPDVIRLTLSRLSVPVVVIIDELDRLPRRRSDISRLFADTVKSLSDHSSPVTLVLVGVADSVSELLAEHQSVERALVQIHMPRMRPAELQEIITKGATVLGISVDDDLPEIFAQLSMGFPYFTHLLAHHTFSEAIQKGSPKVTLGHLGAAMAMAVTNAEHSVVQLYHRATDTTRPGTLFEPVLLACALCEVDDMGFFTARDVRDKLTAVTRRKYDISSFSRHLNAFCHSRGPILGQNGARRKFRFLNPLMQPYIILRALSNDLLDLNKLISNAKESS